MLNIKKSLLIILLSVLMAAGANWAMAEDNLAQRLAGRILLQIQSHGEAWYVNPTDYKRSSLGRPYEAFVVMKQLGIGITSSDLNKIPIGPFTSSGTDDDTDGMPNNIEIALGTDSNSKDSDNDGYNDLTETTNGYNPNGDGRLPIDLNFTKQQSGKIFLQVQSHGEAWYVNPVNQKRYFLGAPDDAFIIMRNLGLGITNADLAKIVSNQIDNPVVATPPDDDSYPGEGDGQTDQVLNNAAQAIRSGNTAETINYFVPAMSKAIEYTMGYLNADSRLTLANILTGANLSSSNEEEKIYKNEVYFSQGGYEVPVYFHIQKQPDGSWLLANL